MKKHYLLFLIFCFLIIGCSHVTGPGPNPDVMPAPPVQKVALGPGDVLDIKFPFWPELNETQTVRPDGKISLQLIDDVKVTGLTPQELDEKLTELYQGKIKEPVITVVVRGLVQQRIYVGGEVLNPGIIELKGRMTVLDAIMAAGGFEKLHAKMTDVIVVRHIDDKRHSTALDLEAVLNSKESEPFYVAGNDMIFVPRTKISHINQWVDQYISKMVPDIGLRFNFQVSDDVTVGYQQ